VTSSPVVEDHVILAVRESRVFTFSRPNGVVLITSTTVVAVETELFPGLGSISFASTEA
jgi:hypothetical protein